MKGHASSAGRFAAILLCFFLSGAAGLICQVVWGKALGLVFGHAVYAIGKVLAVFMGGLAAGSAWLGKWSEKRAHPIRLYGWIELGVAGTGALSLAGLADVRSLYFGAYPWVSGSPALLLALRFLGAALHPAPRRVLIIGFGSGMTASAVARYPDVERIDCVEIEPAVLQAAAFLEKLNRGVLRDPRMRVHLDDARNFLLTTRQRYDLIISEPSNPWIAGVASLFTDEYYRAARQRLAPGGILVQWVQSYSLDPADLRMIFATLAPHFPEVTLWHSVGPDLIVLARLDRQPLRFDRMRMLWNNSALQEDFAELDLRAPEGLPAYYLLDDDALRRMASGSARNTDDRTLLEYHAPRSLLNRSLADRTAEMIERYRKGLLPANLDPSEERASLEATAESLFEEMEELAAAVRYVNALGKEPATVHLEILRGRALLAQNRGEEAVKSFASAVRLEANSLDAIYWLAEGEHNIHSYVLLNYSWVNS